MKETFHRITTAADPAAVIAEIDPQELADLTRKLRGEGPDTGVPALILALLEVEATERFLSLHP